MTSCYPQAVAAGVAASPTTPLVNAWLADNVKAPRPAFSGSPQSGGMTGRFVPMTDTMQQAGTAFGDAAS